MYFLVLGSIKESVSLGSLFCLKSGVLKTDRLFEISQSIHIAQLTEKSIFIGVG